MQLRHNLCPSVVRIFNETIVKEAELAGKYDWGPISAGEMWHIAEEIFEIAEEGVILRPYNRHFGLTRDVLAHESEAAHVNLVCAIVDQALVKQYGHGVHYVADGLSYREIMDAIRHPGLLANLRESVADSEDGELSATHRLLYLADKAADIIMALYHDITDTKLRRIREPSMPERERQILEICDNSLGFVSEMWTIDFVKLQGLSHFDDTGFFTELIVMATLQARGVWYTWREKDYK